MVEIFGEVRFRSPRDKVLGGLARRLSITVKTVKSIVEKFVVAQFVFGFSALAAMGLITFGTCAYASGPHKGAGASNASSVNANGSIAGVVRDSAGTPQIGIAIELLRADSTMVSRVFTDQRGIYSIAALVPGQYALRAMGGSFIPSLKQNLRVRSSTVVNLTLNTLYDLMQWAPQPQKPRVEGQDDWAWTLRTAASRPLLRWQDDDSPVLISDGRAETTSAAQREARRGFGTKGLSRVSMSGGTGQFGSGSEQLAFATVRDSSARRKMVMSGDLAPGFGGAADAMVGFRQEMASSGMGTSSVQALAAVLSEPAIGAGTARGLQAASIRSWESLELLKTLEAEAGSDQVLARVGDGGSKSSLMATLPFAQVTLHRGASALEYRMATARTRSPGSGVTGGIGNESGEAMPGAWLPILSERNGSLELEHGMHQELGWSTSAGPAEMQVVIYADRIDNPMIEAAGHLSAAEAADDSVLVDGDSGLLRTAGPRYSSTGMTATIQSRLPGNNSVTLSYASGDALVMHANAVPKDISVILNGAVARRAQMYSLVLSGTAEGMGTRWRASYRWQPDTTMTEVAPYSVDASSPYLNVSVRQPIWSSHGSSAETNRTGGAGVEAQLDLRNLLAEGYQPFLTSDGSHLYFAQAQRSVRGGLAFTF